MRGADVSKKNADRDDEPEEGGELGKVKNHTGG